jgi:hypothetical protein
MYRARVSCYVPSVLISVSLSSISSCSGWNWLEGLILKAACVSLLLSSPMLNFLAHLSWKLKWAFLIAGCPSSVYPSVNFYIFGFFSRTTGPILTRLGTNHPWVKGIQVCSNEGDSPSPRWDNNTLNIFKNLLLQNQQAKFNWTWYKLSLGEGNSNLFK